MALIDRLNSNLSFSLVDIASTFSDLSPSASGMDVDGLTEAVSPLQQLDLGPISTALTAVAQQGREQLGGLAEVSGLLAPLTRVLEQAEALRSSEPGALLERLQAPFAREDDDLQGVELITSALGHIETITSDRTLAPVMQLTQSLSSGALDVAGTLPAFIEKGRAVTQLVGAMAGLMTIWSQVEQMVETSAHIAELLTADEVEQRYGQLAAWFDNADLSPRLAAIDPNDGAAVDELVPQIQEYLEALRQYYELIQRGFGFGEATLTHASFREAMATIAQASQALQSHQVVDPIRNLAVAIQTWLDERLPATWPDTETSIEQVPERFGELIDDLADTINDIDVEQLARPVTGAINSVTEVVAEVNRAMDTVASALRSAMTVVRDVIAGLNLQGVAETIRAVVQPVADVIA